MRGEYTLRDFMRQLGYEAVRVPLSGASEGYKGDVVATKDGLTLTLELKCRKSAFSKIYWLAAQQQLPHGFVLQNHRLVTISNQPEKVETFERVETALMRIDASSRKMLVRALAQVANLEKLKGDCDYLVIKDDRKPLLFISYA